MYLFMAEPMLHPFEKGCSGSQSVGTYTLSGKDGMIGVAVSDGSSMDKDKEDKHQWPLQLPATAIVDEDKLQWKQMDNWSQLYRDLPLLLASIDTTRYSSGVEPLHEVGDHTIIPLLSSTI
jgi:hypothetical protein